MPQRKEKCCSRCTITVDIDDLKIQEEKALTLLSDSEHSNIKFPMQTALIFKERTQVKVLREKGLSQPNYLLCYKDQIYIPKSLKQKIFSWYHKYSRHPVQNCTEKTIRHSMTWPCLTQDVEHFCPTCPDCQLTKSKCLNIRIKKIIPNNKGFEQYPV
jgi:Integrase zinc binding domain